MLGEAIAAGGSRKLGRGRNSAGDRQVLLFWDRQEVQPGTDKSCSCADRNFAPFGSPRPTHIGSAAGRDGVSEEAIKLLKEQIGPESNLPAEDVVGDWPSVR